MEYILIDNGKKSNEQLNASLLFPLPVDTPYGNFSLKLFKIVWRLDEANRRIVEVFDTWERALDGSDGLAYQKHILSIEQVIYLIRKSCDEIISLIWCLDYFSKNNKYPKKIECDRIASVTNEKSKYKAMNPFTNHIEMLEQLNGISNAYKHSFLNSDIDLIGKDEPCVNALALDNNKLSCEPKFYSVSFKWLISGYNEFYKDCISWLKNYNNK